MSRMKWLLLGLVSLSVACCLLFSGTTRLRIDEPWHHSAVRLKDIGYALHQYQSVYGSFPPAVVRDKDGNPLYSWRVLLLSSLDQSEVEKRFRLDEPWDSPHNRTLLEKTPRCYLPIGGGKDALGLTRFQVFVGPGTAFERDGLTIHDFPNGLANTLLVVEAGEPVPWSKPADLAFKPERPLPVLGGVHQKQVRHWIGEPTWKPGFVACFGDLTTRFISTTDESIIRGLISRIGSERVDLSHVD